MAIAFDATSNSGDKSGTSFSWSHTCTGSELLLLVGVGIRDSTPTTVTGITYNSVALTNLRTDVSSLRASSELWYLVAPATGANTVAVTMSASTEDCSAGAVSFTGVDQTTPMDVAGGAGATDSSGSSTNATKAITTVTDNAWTFAVCQWQFQATLTIGSGQTQRWNITYNITNGQSAGGTSSAAVSPAGSKTMNWTSSVAGNWAISVAAVRPSGGAGGRTTKNTRAFTLGTEAGMNWRGNLG